MREIKFRAWDKGQMYYNVQNSYDTLSNGATDKVGNNIDYEWDSFGHVIKSCESLMQYTGLKDKDGVGVYEGDIVKCSSGCPHEITWMQEVPSSGLGGMPGFYMKGLNEGYVWTKLEEVIGNIYENPELLEEV